VKAAARELDFADDDDGDDAPCKSQIEETSCWLGLPDIHISKWLCSKCKIHTDTATATDTDTATDTEDQVGDSSSFSSCQSQVGELLWQF